MNSRMMRPRLTLRVAFVAGMLGALCLVLPQRPVRAASSGLVRIDRASLDTVDPELWSTLDPLLSHVGLRMIEEPADSDTVAHVVLTTNSRGVSILVLDPRRSGTPIRREVAREGSPALFRETVAQVILSMVEPIAEPPPSRELAPPPAAPAPTVVAQAPKPDAPPRDARPGTIAYFLGARSGVGFVGPDATKPAVGANLGLRLTKAWARPVLVAEGLFVFPHEVKDARTASTLRASQLRALASLTVWGKGRGALELGLGPGLDLVAFEAKRVSPDLKAKPESRRLQPLLALRAQARVGLLEWLSLMGGVGLDVDLSPRRWAVDRGREEEVIFETGRIRPQFVAALDFRLGGPSLREPGRRP